MNSGERRVNAEPGRKAALPWGRKPPSWLCLASTPVSLSLRAQQPPHTCKDSAAQCPVSLQPAGRRRNAQVKGHRVPALGRPRAEMGPFTPCLLTRAGAEKPHCHQRSGLRAPNPCQRSRTGLVDLGTAGQGKGTVPSSVSAPRHPWPLPARGQQHPLPSVTTIETSHCQGLPGVRRQPRLRTIILEGKNTETST